MNKPVIIYTISHPDTDEVVYVGMTTKVLKQRLMEHETSRKKNKEKVGWLLDLKNEGKRALIEQVDYIEPNGNWQFWEIYWIAQFKAWGFKLLNKTKGGECGVISPQCEKAKIMSLKGKPAHNKGGSQSESAKNLIKEKRKLQVITEEHRINISKGMKGKKKSPESIAKRTETRKINKLKNKNYAVRQKTR